MSSSGASAPAKAIDEVSPPSIADKQTLLQQFDAACAHTPTPVLTPTQLPDLLPQHNAYLVRNAAGDILLSPQVVTDNDVTTRRDIATAIYSALRHAAVAADEGNASPSGRVIEPSTPLFMSHDEQAAKADTPQSDNTTITAPTPQPSLLQLLDSQRFTPLESLSSLDWDHTTAQRVLQAFAKKAKPATSTTPPVANNRLVQSNSFLTQRSSSSPPPDVIDTVVLAAQQEAAASAILKDLRIAHARLRKSTSVMRPGATPLWALLAHRGGKLKPEAAAEMARARVAAAAAAAVMRDAAAQQASLSNPTAGGAQHNANSLAEAVVTRPHVPLPLVQLPDPGAYHDHDFLNEYISPCVRPSPNPSDTLLYRQPVPPPPPPSSIDSTNVRAGKPLNKKRVAFVEGTIFHMRK